MRDFNTLLNDATFYSKIDKEVPDAQNLKNWYNNLPNEEKQILSDGLVELAKQISGMFGWLPNENR